MDFLTWLLQQNKRKDDVGWISRQINANATSQDEIRKEASSDTTKSYITTMPKCKISIVLMTGYQEWAGQYKEATRPQVGIFWIVNGQVISFEEDATTLPWVAGFKDTRLTHVEVWPQMQKVYPIYRHREYDEIPRGRVIGVQPNRFRIFLRTEDARNKAIVNRIMGAFSLPRGLAEVMTDEHYEIDLAQQYTGISQDESFEQDDMGDDEL